MFSFFGVVHSASPDGAMYLPWDLQGLARQVPYQFAAAYLVLAVLFLLPVLLAVAVAVSGGPSGGDCLRGAPNRSDPHCTT